MFSLELNAMKLVPLLIIYSSCQLCGFMVNADIEYNTINEDGSFQFRHSNDDIGGYYHSATGSPDNIVRGRYGSRNPASGQIEETVYTAGPRGFRVNGPEIHRKMDLAQYPPRPIGSPDDPLADPFDDPSYSFKYRTPDQSRSEDNDATGRVRGLYSFIDDVGERHSVRYAAGAGTGFEISNAVPDNPTNVAYTAPLYKSHARTRGKMAVQRGPNGSYKLIAAGPDHRRAESRGTDGLVRGTYSFLDDKGVQRTVEYIAGAGIGYRVVQNRVGPGTHINPSVSDFRLSDTDFRLANEYGRGAGPVTATIGSSSSSSGAVNDGEYLKVSGSGRIRPRDPENPYDNAAADDQEDNEDTLPSLPDQRQRPKASGSARNKNDRVGTVAGGNRGSTRYFGTAAESGGSNSERGAGKVGGRGGSGVSDGGPSGGGRPNNKNNANTGQRMQNRGSNRDRPSTAAASGGSSAGSANRGSSFSSSNSGSGGYNYNAPTGTNYNLNDEDVGSLPPLITANRKILEIDRERDWVERHHDSTVIKNVGKWYIGLPPGQSVRAHVQNIDLLPLGGRRVPSPSEALRADELADMFASRENGVAYNS